VSGPGLLGVPALLHALIHPSAWRDCMKSSSSGISSVYLIVQDGNDRVEKEREL
jgi:hypothetical protein